jgi:hypothetical protein
MTPAPIFRACLFAALSCAALACGAQAPPPDERAMDAEEAAQLQAMQDAAGTYYARTAAELAASGKPRELAFAATLLQLAQWTPADTPPGGDAPSKPSPRDPRVGQWRQLASARAGSDVLANALLMQGDARADAVVRAQAADRWQRLEPDNLAPLLSANGKVEAWLPKAGAYARMDQHYYEQLRWMQAALVAHPPRADEQAMFGDSELPADAAAAIQAASILAAVAMPSLTPLMDACRGDALEVAPTRRADCRQVAGTAAERSATSLGVSIGIALLQATAATPAQQADAQARRRRHDWRMLEWGRVAAAQPDQGAAQFVRLLRDPAVRSERDLIDRVLAEAGVAPEPPAGWQPPRR